MQYKVETGSLDAALDRERTKSMADEGGMAGAEMDLAEQQSAAPLAVATRSRGWNVRLLISALAVGVAAAVLTRIFAGGRKRRRKLWFR
ncbi:MAG TPA: hypothetical protein VJR89_06395 [Polyangiales bacterium]|nr:hypothetical protein [Polyangiales bacterium]